MKNQSKKCYFSWYRLIFVLIFIAKTSAIFSQESVGNLPTHQFFIENKGQWPDEVLYLTKVNGYNAWVTKSGVIFDFFQFKEIASTQSFALSIGDADDGKAYQKYGQVVSFTLENSLIPAPLSRKKKKGYYNYLIGNDRSKWASNVGLYQEVQLDDIYSGIDLRYYFEDGQLRYDYIVSPGGDAKELLIAIAGTEKITINAKGELVFTTRFGEVRQQGLLLYQIINSKKVFVDGRFISTPRGIQIEVGDYDMTKNLIIDPLVFATFLGGNSTDYCARRGLVVDEDANIYLGVTTQSDDFPITVGAYDDITESQDVSVTKINKNGTDLLFSTFVGGNVVETLGAIALDEMDNVILFGRTAENGNFPVTSGAYSTTFSGGVTDAFVCKLNNLGTDLIFSTLLGGESNDRSQAMVTDSDGSIYLLGITTSQDFPTTNGAIDESYNGMNDLYIAKLKADGSSLLYSTFLGGGEDDIGRNIAIDADQNVYIVGRTYSADYPVTSGTLGEVYNGDSDVLVSKINSSGTNLIFSTFLGTSEPDEGASIAVDKLSNVYIGGYTYSPSFPVTSGSFDVSYGGDINDIFVAKLKPDASALTFSTFLGGNGRETVFSMVLDVDDMIYCTGWTSSTDFPTTMDAYDMSANGGLDPYVFVMKADGTDLIYSSYFGGSENEYSRVITIDEHKTIYFAGGTKSQDFPTTSDVIQPDYGGSYRDVFLVKLGLDNLLPDCTLLVYPANGSQNINLNTQLTWDTVPNATGYFLTIGTTSGGNDILNHFDVNNSTSYDLNSLSPLTTYFVTIIPYNNAGEAILCGQIHFTTLNNAIVITQQPDNHIVMCESFTNDILNNWLNIHGGATATGGCSTLNWTNDFLGLSDGCGSTGQATVTFTVSDNCGNSVTTLATIFSVIDTMPPVILAQAVDTSVNCNDIQLSDWLDHHGNAQAMDNCGGVTWSNNFSNILDGCTTPAVLFTATDECGLTSTTSANITVENPTQMSISSVATPLILSCDSVKNLTLLNNWLANHGGSQVVNNCGSVVWSSNYLPMSLDCNLLDSVGVTYTATDACGDVVSTNTFIIFEKECAFELYQNKPNPFFFDTTVGFNLPKATNATLSIYNSLGQILYSYSGDYEKCYNELKGVGLGLKVAGIYYYRLSTSTNSAAKKMILIR